MEKKKQKKTVNEKSIQPKKKQTRKSILGHCTVVT